MGKLFGTIFGMLCVIVVVVVLIGVATHPDKDRDSTETASAQETVTWKDTFKGNGFSDEEISSYENTLSEVGVSSSDIDSVNIIENGAMHIIRGKVFGKDSLQLNVTLENREIIYIGFTGFPEYTTTTYINWLGKLKLKGEIVPGQVDLFSDTEGGSLAKADWENQKITDMDGNLITQIQ